MTAAAFAKGLLALEGSIPPILVSLVRNDDVANELLDDSSRARKQVCAESVLLMGLLCGLSCKLATRTLLEECDLYHHPLPLLTSKDQSFLGNFGSF